MQYMLLMHLRMIDIWVQVRYQIVEMAYVVHRTHRSPDPQCWNWAPWKLVFRHILFPQDHGCQPLWCCEWRLDISRLYPSLGDLFTAGRNRHYGVEAGYHEPSR